ncbi:hypothetical protein ACFSHP_20235 [Novosphingobium panipatense]
MSNYSNAATRGLEPSRCREDGRGYDDNTCRHSDVSSLFMKACVRRADGHWQAMDIPGIYHDWIIWIGDGTGLPDAILHIHAGLAILLLVRLVSGRSLGTFIPFAAVVLGEFGNELLDYLHYGLRVGDTLSDIGNTLFWPFVISLAVRLRPMPARDR